MKQFISSLLRATVLRWFDNLYLWMDKTFIRRAYHLKLTPDILHRTGGKIAYSEYIHSIGIFQTLIMQNLHNHHDARILDVGCGTGLLGIACFPLTNQGSQYLGIDVHKPSITYCQSHFPKQGYQFQHLDANNPAYTPEQKATQKAWDIGDNSQDLVTALSVWTHFSEADATFYLSEVARVLKPGSRAIITFFILDEAYEQFVSKRQAKQSKYHGSLETKWIFDTSAYESENWYHPNWTNVPEEAIGISHQGLEILLEKSGLSLVEMYAGNWREQSALFFQDILVLEKPNID